jgi:hypothetical protein
VHKQNVLKCGEKLLKFCIWGTALCCAEKFGTELGKVDMKYFERFEMRHWRRMEKISWNDPVRNEEVLHRDKEERNILHTVKGRKDNWIGQILRGNWLLKHVIEGKLAGRIEVRGRRGRRSKQLLDALKETRGYWELKEEALDRTLWRTGFGRGCGPVGGQTDE